MKADPTRGRAIALMIETDGPGGAETVVLRLAEGLRARGHRVMTVGPAGRCGWLSGQLRERGFHHEFYRHDRTLDPAFLRELVGILRRGEVELVHSHEFTMGVYGGMATALLRLPHVVTIHGRGYWWERRRRRWALSWALARSHRAVAVSEEIRQEMIQRLGLPPEKVEVISNGVPESAASPTRVREELHMAPGEPLVLAVGNLYRVKGHVHLLEALGRLQERNPGLTWRAAIAGRGEEEPRLREMAEQLRIAHRTHFLGFREDIPELLAAASVFTLPSLSEGHPLSLLEAMLAGVPVVASAVGGVPEVVEDEHSALLVPPADAGALADGLERLLTGPDLRTRLARNARRLALDRYSLEAMLDAHERAYNVEPASPVRRDRPGASRARPGRSRPRLRKAR